jgi:hypothetical protein
MMPLVPAHPGGEHPPVVQDAQLAATTVDTWSGQVRVEWDPPSPLTPFGQLPFLRIPQGVRTVRRLGYGLAGECRRSWRMIWRQGRPPSLGVRDQRAAHAALFRLRWINTSAEMPRRSCRRRIIAIDSPRFRLRTSAMRVRVPIIA